jgi:hypothetical protein
VAKARDEDTPESTTTYVVEDIWLNAMAKLPNTRALAALLRTHELPMPPGIRNLLAELLSPGSPDISGGRLVYKPTKGIELAIEEWLPPVADYYAEAERQRQTGKSDASQNAAARVGRRNKRSDRTVYRKLRAWRSLVARLREH